MKKVVILIIMILCVSIVFLSCGNKEKTYKINNNCTINISILNDDEQMVYLSNKINNKEDNNIGKKVLSKNNFKYVIIKNNKNIKSMFAIIENTSQNDFLQVWNANIGKFICVTINGKSTVFGKILEKKEKIVEVYIWNESQSNIIGINEIILK